jgi:hypothetical protein
MLLEHAFPVLNIPSRTGPPRDRRWSMITVGATGPQFKSISPIARQYIGSGNVDESRDLER